MRQVMAETQKTGIRAAERIFNALIDDIVAGRARPGEPLTEILLAEQFNVSRTPVREALHRLEQIQMAERGQRRAFFVRQLTREELTELFEAVGEVEGAIAGLAAQRMTEIERLTLAAILEEGAQSGEDPLLYGRINTRFHEALKAGAHNAILAETLDELNRRVLPWRHANFATDPGRIVTSRHEHEAIAAAVRQRRSEEAAHLVKVHVAASHKVTIDRLVSRENLG